MSVRCDYLNTPMLQLPTTCDVTGYIEMLPEPQDAAGWCPSLRQHPAASQCIRQHPAATGNCPNLNNAFLINGQYPNDSGSIRCFRQVTGKKYIFADDENRYTRLTRVRVLARIGPSHTPILARHAFHGGHLSRGIRRVLARCIINHTVLYRSCSTFIVRLPRQYME